MNFAELPAEMNEAANPGSMEAALLDLALLSTCDDMVVTVASSFGWVAGRADMAFPLYNTASPCTSQIHSTAEVLNCTLTPGYSMTVRLRDVLAMQRPWAAWPRYRCFMECTLPHRTRTFTGLFKDTSHDKGWQPILS